MDPYPLTGFVQYDVRSEMEEAGRYIGGPLYMSEHDAYCHEKHQDLHKAGCTQPPSSFP